MRIYVMYCVMYKDDCMLIYPVIEFKDLMYAHQYGWLEALARTTEGDVNVIYQQANVPIRHVGGLVW